MLSTLPRFLFPAEAAAKASAAEKTLPEAEAKAAAAASY
jgi:hypothetical protein